MFKNVGVPYLTSILDLRTSKTKSSCQKWFELQSFWWFIHHCCKMSTHCGSEVHACWSVANNTSSLKVLKLWAATQPFIFLPCSCWQTDRKALYCCALYYYYLKTRQWLSISERSLKLKMTICLSLYEWALSGASWSTLSGSSGPFVQSTKPNLIDLALPVRLQSQ